MNMIDTSTNKLPKFLDDTHDEIDKILWRHAYATYLIITSKKPEECAKYPTNLTALLHILSNLDQRRNEAESDMK